MKTVYLAGPIVDCTDVEANEWRARVSIALHRFNIRGISPLRVQEAADHNGRYGVSSGGPTVAHKNFLDVQLCTLTLCYLPRVMTERRYPIGTTIEMGLAHALGKPVIVVTNDPRFYDHPLVQKCAGWIFCDPDVGLDMAVSKIVELLGDYA